MHDLGKRIQMKAIPEVGRFRYEIAIVCLFALAFCLTVIWALGRDLSWDSLSYHYYVGHGYWHDRLSQDFFPSGIYGYGNPLLYIPFFLMVWSGWHTIAISSMLAVLHSLNVILMYMIGGEIVGWDRDRIKDRILVLGLSVISLPFIQYIGTSHGDLLQLVFQLFSIYLALCAVRTDRGYRWAISAFSMGFAAGLKLSGLLFCAGYAVFVMLYALSNFGYRRATTILLLCGIAGILGFLAASLSWMLQMWEHFGNPLFPFFNNFFKSPYFPAEGVADARFTVSSLEELLVLPIKMGLPVAYVYFEQRAPDFRLAVFVILALPVTYRYMRVFFSEKKLTTMLICIFGYLAIFVLWSFTSANVRYGFLLFILVGPMLFVLARDLFGRKNACMVSLILILIQSIAIGAVGPSRMSKEEWSADWYGFEVPESHKATAHLYLTGDMLSYSFLVRDVNADSAFVNIISGMPVDNESVRNRLTVLRKKYNNKAIALFQSAYASTTHPKFADLARAYAASYRKFGYTMSLEGCEIISSAVKAEVNAVPGEKKLASCLLSYDKATELEMMKVLDTVELVFEKIRNHCSSSLGKFGYPANGTGESYIKYFPAVGGRLWVNEKKNIFFTTFWSISEFYLGKFDQWQRDDGSAKKEECNLMEAIR